jgi:DNA-binding response OmpR family regulator
MTMKVLSVDDSRTIRMIVSKAFKSYDCEVFEAENGLEGLDLTAKQKPDLIILDITMPVMTGIEMLSKLKQNPELKHIPVIMLTAESGKDHVMQIVKMGVTDYIVKPFKGEQLIERAKSILSLKPHLDMNEKKQGDDTPSIFSAEGETVILKFPEKITRSIGTQIETAFKNKINQMNAAGARNLIIVTNTMIDFSMTAIQLLISVASICIRCKLNVRLVATDSQTKALKGFKETSGIAAYGSIEQAKATV